MINFIYTIITAIIATTLFELCKIAVVKIWNKSLEKRLLFSLSGYWCSYHESLDLRTKEVLSAFELIHLEYSRGQVKMKLYQLTGDGRKYQYAGVGFLRGDKLTIAYEESGRYASNKVGAFVLGLYNQIEHSVVLKGQYHELMGKSFVCQNNEYTLKECRVTALNRKTKLSTENIFKLMEEDYFKDVCKSSKL